MSGIGHTGWWGFALDAPEPLELARFYERLLGWRIEKEEPDWVTLRPPGGGHAYLGIHVNSQHVRPVWPPEAGQQQIQAHLDFEVEDLAAAVAHAESVGAVQAEFQPQDNIRVMLDPVGHPFCLYTA